MKNHKLLMFANHFLVRYIEKRLSRLTNGQNLASSFFFLKFKSSVKILIFFR